MYFLGFIGDFWGGFGVRVCIVLRELGFEYGFLGVDSVLVGYVFWR